MRFPYKMTRVGRPVLTLGGRWVRPQPLIHVALVGPIATRPVLGILDTAADDTVFPDYVAADRPRFDGRSHWKFIRNR